MQVDRGCDSRHTKLRNLGLGWADHAIAEIGKQLHWRAVAVHRQERGTALVEVKHPRFFLSCDDHWLLHGYNGFWPQVDDQRPVMLPCAATRPVTARWSASVSEFIGNSTKEINWRRAYTVNT